MGISKVLSALLILMLSLTVGCSLSNRVEDIKVLCSIKDVNRHLTYIRILNPESGFLNTQQLASLSAELIHEDGRVESLVPSSRGCVAVPKISGQLSVRTSGEREWVAFARLLSAEEDLSFRDLALAERGQLTIQLPCPDQGFIANEVLANALLVKNRSGDLQNLQITLAVQDKSGEALGTLFKKEFGSHDLQSPARLSVEALPEGEYALQMSLRDSFFGTNPKSLVATGQCPLIVKRSCSSASDSFNPDTVSCVPKLCDNKYRVGEFWSEDLSNQKGRGLFNCQLQSGQATKVATDATCKPGYFETKGSCIGARQVAAGFNHSCALLENGEVSCWGHNVFGRLGVGDKLGNAGQVLGPQAAVDLAEPASAIAVGTLSSCALLNSGRMQCWGFLPSGLDDKGFLQYQVFDAPRIMQREEGKDLTGVQSIAMGGGPDRDTFCAVTEDKAGLCWGKDLFSHRQTLQFGNWLYPQRVFPGASIQQLALTDREICGLDSSGQVFCQGSGLGKDLSQITDASRAEPIAVQLPPSRALFTRSRVKCSILKDERVFCWDLRTDSEDPAQFTFGFGVPDIHRVLTDPFEKMEYSEQLKEAGLNAEISCYLSKSHKPACQLGASSSGGLVMDVLKTNGEPLTDITSISVGFWHACGVQQNGQVSCWGDNQFGRLGNGTIGESGDGEGIPRFIQATLILSP